MRLSREQMQNIVDDLQGTCQSLDQAVENECGEDLNHIDNEMELCNYIDERVFVCGDCGWWCEAGDWITDEHPRYDPANGDICSSCGEYN